MEKISLEGWRLFSNRDSSVSYVNSDETQMLKTYKNLNEDKIKSIHAEHAMTSAVQSLGIPTPDTTDIVEIEGGGIGAIYQNIRGKLSLSRGISQDFSKMEYYTEKFVKLGKQIHETKCNPEKFDSFAAKLADAVNVLDDVYSDDEKQKLIAAVKSVPETGTCLHGDFHPGNFITGEQGDFAIDLGGFGYGNPLFDWAQWYFMSYFLPPFAYDHVFHMPQEKVQECFWLSVKMSFPEMSEEEQKTYIDSVEPFAHFIAAPFAGIFDAAKDDLRHLKPGCRFLK